MIIALIVGGLFGYLVVSNYIDIMNLKDEVQDLKELNLRK